ncbi:Cell division protein FtsK [Cronobacter universalis NCTC 9529]|nr:Cell division protein FtsK [Cronobacter universalis NCTC 9529]
MAGEAPRPQVKEGIGPQLPRPNRVRVPTRRELASYGIKLPSQRMAEERAREEAERRMAQQQQGVSDEEADAMYQDELARQFAASQQQRYGEEYQAEMSPEEEDAAEMRQRILRRRR